MPAGFGPESYCIKLQEGQLFFPNHKSARCPRPGLVFEVIQVEDDGSLASPIATPLLSPAGIPASASARAAAWYLAHRVPRLQQLPQ